MRKNRKSSIRAAALLSAVMLLFCPLAMGADTPEALADTGLSAQTETPKLNSFVNDGFIQVRDLEKVARDYEKVPAEFLWAIEDQEDMTVEEFEEYALEYKLPAQYVQRFIDDNFVFQQGNTYQYIPVRDDLTRHSYNWDNLTHNDWTGEKDYIVDAQSRAVKVIDVSVHQGDIDWEAVKADGVDYAFIRLGYRGYTKGEIFLDDKYERNMRKAAEAGVKVGV